MPEIQVQYKILTKQGEEQMANNLMLNVDEDLDINNDITMLAN
ncbi:MAG: hypothetical protein UHO61_04270 [Acutalibacteraceae bacterium]|nr:hypothetical protein [Acutalibacteraceae bacterium]